MKKEIRLNDIPKRNVHQVPEGYFDRLPARIMERTAAREHVSATPWYAALWRPARLAAAPLILLLLFIGVYYFTIRQEPLYTGVAFASLTEDEIVEYLDTYARIEDADLAEYSVADQELTADYLNITSTAAEEELEYYDLNDIEY